MKKVTTEQQCLGFFLIMSVLLAGHASSFEYCYGMKTCEECVSYKSWWLNYSCRWCRKDNQCHAYGAVTTNPCTEAENLHRGVSNWQDMCDAIPLPSNYEYDVELSYKALTASAAAYHWPSTCITFLRPESQFYVTQDYETLCNWFLTIDFCSAFIAVSEKEETMVVAFRGSSDQGQVFSQVAETLAKPKKNFVGKAQVESYYKTAFEKLWATGLHKDFRQLRQLYPHFKVLITGHSLGGALASLTSLWMAYHKFVPASQLFLYTFGSPRVGDLEYAMIHDRYVIKSMRVVHTWDLVPQFPCSITYTPHPPCHHATLVSYKNTAIYNDKTAFAVYRTLPYNETLKCSLKPELLHLEHHTNYFNLDVGGHCIGHNDKVGKFYPSQLL